MLRQTHSICLLERSSDYGRLYETIGRYLAEGYGVIYAAEQDPEWVINKMAKAGLQVEQHIRNGTLRVISGESVYVSNGDDLDASRTIESWLSVVSNIMNNTKVKGVIAIGSVDAFIKRGRHKSSAEYETHIGKKFEVPLEAICCYNADSLSDMSAGTLITILNAHQYTIHDNAEYSEWEGDKLQSILIAAFDRVLGTTTSALVLKTLKSVYKLDERSIISEPTLLEDVLGKFFRASSNAILASILKNLKSEMAFHRQTI
ncbi:MAG: MEDS domain-containing protein [Nitrososphaera sp.]|uniref:MEDS domain-containing protein n=1 Tax=Nitrososphaera sp. TaxID=1971748 RepID=UPI003D6F2198